MFELGRCEPAELKDHRWIRLSCQFQIALEIVPI